MIPQIHPAELARKLQAQEPVYLLDVRQHWEYEQCHLPGSVLIPLPELPQRLNELEVPAQALIVVYCHHGIRSLSGAAILHQAGLSKAVSLSGGIEAWSLQIDSSVPRY